MKKDPPNIRHRKTSSLPKIKLICRINGVFKPKSPSGKLHYVGGETRIVSVDRNVGFLQLVSKISELYPNISSFSIKYQLPESNDSDEGTPLVSITTDEDVRCMIEEYDKAESNGRKHTRLWVFVSSTTCDSNCYVDQDSSFNGFSPVLGNSDLGFRNEQPKIPNPHIAGIYNCEYLLRKVVGCPGLIAVEASEPQTQNFYNPFRESVCIPQFQTIQTSGVQSFFDSDRSNMSDYSIQITHSPGSQNVDRLVQFNPHGDLGIGANFSTQFPSERFNESMVCRGGGNAGIFNQSVATTPFGKDVHNISAVPMSSGWNGNPGWTNIDEVSIGNSNYGKAAYCDSVQRSSTLAFNNQFIGRVYQKKAAVSSNMGGNSIQFRSRVHRNGGTDMRNQRNSPYHIRNHRNNLPEMGNYHGIGFDGMACSGKSYHGLRPSSNIFKHGQAMRLNYTHLWKQWSSVHDNAWEGMVRMVEFSKPTQTSFNIKNSNGISTQQIEQRTGGRCAFGSLSRQNNHLSAEFNNSSPHMNHLAYHNMNYASPLSCQFIENHYPSFRAMNTQELLNYPNDEKSRKSEARIKNVHGTHDAYVPENGSSVYPDLNRDPSFLSSKKNVEIPGFSMEAGYRTSDELIHGIFPKFDQKLQLDTKIAAITSSNDHNDVGTLSDVVTSSVDLSLHKLSLSSSKGAKSPTSSLASNDIYESSPVCEMGAQPNLSLDLIDQGQFSSGPLVEKSGGDTLNFSVESAAVLKKNLSRRKDNNQGTPSSLVIDEKDDSNGSRTCPKDVGRICSDLVAFYTDLATRELQTIKNSDLEDIRELGSGTYGTVFYGKWKGSDVAIKRIKATCFSAGQLEEDRLIADFWREAHILSQLHHPNVVSFYGVVKDGPVTNLATVTEYMVNGSLKQVLLRKDRTIDRRKRLLVAMDAAFGMEYLHEKNIVHFDLKSHNFLMNMKDPLRPVCKIGDMGLSKVKQKTLVSGGVRGTISWMAPELLTSENNMVTEKVDVYSFGIVMWELLTGEEPYAHMPTEETIAGIIKGDLRPEIPSWCDPMWRSLMERCWSSDPGSRPSFSEIAKELRSMAAAMNIK